MWRNRIDDEVTAFSPMIVCGVESVVLQKEKEQRLGLLGTETPGYIPVDEKLGAKVGSRQYLRARSTTSRSPLGFGSLYAIECFRGGRGGDWGDDFSARP